MKLSGKKKIINYESQLLRYLNEQRSRIGILFNGDDVILFRKDDKKTDFSKNYLSSLEDVSSRLLEATHQVNDDCLEFVRQEMEM
jgi:hypothetical protein